MAARLDGPDDLNIAQVAITIPDNIIRDGVDWTELAGGETFLKLRVFQGDFQALVNRALTHATLHSVAEGATIETALQQQEKAIRLALSAALETSLMREGLLER